MTICLENIGKTYNGRVVLSDFNLDIEDDRCYAIIGPAGSGKTTILKIFMGDIKPDSGRVARMGDYKYPNLRSAYVPQENDYKPRKSPIWHLRKADRTITKENAIEELSRFLTAEEQNMPMGELSDTKQRLVAIIKAMMLHADFIVLDEPFVGMDPELTERAKEYILSKRGRRPLIITAQTEKGLEFARKRFIDNQD